MKTIQKFLLILIMATCVFAIIPINTSKAGLSDLVDRMEPNTSEASEEAESLTTIAGDVLGVLQLVSGLFTIILIAITGVEYIIAATPDIKQELKKRMVPIILGLVCVFSAVSIATFVLSALE